MEREKFKYEVYVDRVTHTYLGTSRKTNLLGETWAVSAKKAISNIKYRLKLSSKKDNMYADTTVDRYFAVKKGGN